MMKKSKAERILCIYVRLHDGNVINKTQEALDFGVNERTIQRDIDDIRAFMSDWMTDQTLD